MCIFMYHITVVEMKQLTSLKVHKQARLEYTKTHLALSQRYMNLDK